MTRKRLILVVNDDPYLIDAIEDVLRGAGYDSVGYKASSEAREAIRHRLPDLVVVDINLEHPTAGWTFVQLLRLDRQTEQIPVILATADVDFVRAKGKALQQLGCAVLEKPFSIDALLREVAAIMPGPAPPDTPPSSGPAT